MTNVTFFFLIKMNQMGFKNNYFEIYFLLLQLCQVHGIFSRVALQSLGSSPRSLCFACAPNTPEVIKVV